MAMASIAYYRPTHPVSARETYFHFDFVAIGPRFVQVVVQ